MAEGQEYKWVGTHVQEITGGRMLEPGERMTLDEEAVEEYHNADLIAQGLLIPLGEAAEPLASEAAVDLAQQEGVQLNAVTGTGVDGRITKADVERHLAETVRADEGGDS